MARVTKKCGFCGKVGPHPEAHLFPRSMHCGEPGQGLMVFQIGRIAPVRKSPTGIYDPELWCDECEARSSTLDTYAGKTLLDEKNVIAEPGMVDDAGEPVLYKCVNADPIQLQLFALSVIWRASASKRLEVKAFSLGPYQDRVRDILLTEDHQRLAHHPLIIQFETVPELRGGFFPPARTSKRDFVLFRGGGFAFRVKMTNRRLSLDLEPFAIKAGSPVQMVSYSLLKTPIGREVVSTVKGIERRFRRAR